MNSLIIVIQSKLYLALAFYLLLLLTPVAFVGIAHNLFKKSMTKSWHFDFLAINCSIIASYLLIMIEIEYRLFARGTALREYTSYALSSIDSQLSAIIEIVVILTPITCAFVCLILAFKYKLSILRCTLFGAILNIGGLYLLKKINQNNSIKSEWDDLPSILN